MGGWVHSVLYTVCSHCSSVSVCRSEEEDILVSDLSPASHYVLQMTAHNAAGSRIVTSHVSTLTLLGQTLPPSLLSTPAPATTNSGGVDGGLAISAILAIIIVATVLLLSIYCYKRSVTSVHNLYFL